MGTPWNGAIVESSKVLFAKHIQDLDLLILPLGFSRGESLVQNGSSKAIVYSSANKERRIFLNIIDELGIITITVSNNMDKFSLSYFAKLEKALTWDGPAATIDLKGYFDSKLDFYKQCFSDSDLRRILSGQVWKSWKQDVDWGPYK